MAVSVNLIGITSTLFVVGAVATWSKVGAGIATIVIALVSSENPSVAFEPDAITRMPRRTESGMTATFIGVAWPSSPITTRS